MYALLLMLMVSPVVKVIVLPWAVVASNGYAVIRLKSIRVIDVMAIVLRLVFFKIFHSPFY
jgi:hypothetical protein